MYIITIIIIRPATILRLLGNETIQFNIRGKKSELGLQKQLNIDVNQLQNFFFLKIYEYIYIFYYYKVLTF